MLSARWCAQVCTERDGVHRCVLHVQCLSRQLTDMLRSEGELEVSQRDKILGVIGAGKAFGELAVLYNCQRTASVRGE